MKCRSYKSAEKAKGKAEAKNEAEARLSGDRSSFQKSLEKLVYACLSYFPRDLPASKVWRWLALSIPGSRSIEFSASDKYIAARRTNKKYSHVNK